MKFGKHFKQQKVPEWTGAYMDYNGLKRILGEILQYKQSRQPSTPLRAAMQHKLTSHRHFGGLNLQSTNLSSKGDIEDQVIDVNASPEEGSRKLYYKTEFLRESEGGGEIEARFFKKLDEELNNVNTFYKDKSEEMKDEAFLLNKQMDALIALRISLNDQVVTSSNLAIPIYLIKIKHKVDNPHFDGSDARKSDTTGVATTNPLKSPSRDATSGVEDMNVEHGVEISNDFQLEKSSYEQSGREHMELTSELDRRTDCNQEESTRGPEVIEVQAKDHGNAHQEKDNLTDYNKDPLKILEHVKINKTFKSPLATIKDVFKDSKEEELSFKKEELKKVEERLRGDWKAGGGKTYMKTVDNSCLGNSDEVNGLLERVEAAFIKHFANSNRREGFFSGCSIALLIAVVLRIQARKLMDKAEAAALTGKGPNFFMIKCLRRLCEEKDAVHGYNGLKYFLTIIAVLIRTAYELKKGRTWMVFALISSAAAVIVNTYWDIAVDWGLLRRKSKNAFLRDKLVISHKSVYFAAMSIHKMAALTTISCLEIIRRGIWSFFRLENEHLNNVGKYRAFKSVPLPFTYYDTDADKDD
ncbi:hypothetical protein NC653_020749 [Populus alba x Populus x berolinensis]|uniref:Uncharacterized protein n=1 Tax=Populus alba x Populus x berolinensis TaxID=444605 RepID=A0AAD6MNK1_9ROSI|nr:hypothetical protein NC653_020749 [Populus alba x Populus x berolinensis]